ncbi:MAG: MotA/TolQ/ExbB proton channel family protein [Azoarcus sp.]|nr:MotA/TolQ/ExbB proton channel family protein [Azoarcus sp.]
MLDIFKAGEWPMWPLLLASVIAVALIVERMISLRHARVLPSGLLDRIISDLGRHGGAPPEMITRVANHSPLGRVFAAGLRNIRGSREIMKESIEEAGRTVAHELERFLTTLGTIAAISPLMGLFGTVVGMIKMFGAQGVQGVTGMTELSQGIALALHATAFGIIVAIPAMIFWRHFRRLVDEYVIEMEQQATKLVEMVHGERRR